MSKICGHQKEIFLISGIDKHLVKDIFCHVTAHDLLVLLPKVNHLVHSKDFCPHQLVIWLTRSS